MLTGNKIIKILFTTFAVLLIFINLYYFLAIKQAKDWNVLDTDIKVNTFHGFNWFFNKIASFPGLTRLFDLLTNANGYIKEYDIFNPGENILTLLKIITFPFAIIGTLIWSVIENIWWVLSFILEPVVL